MRSLAFLMLLSSSKADVARIKADVEAIVRDGSTLRAKKVELTNHSHALEGGDGTLFIDRTTGLLRRANVRLLGETYRTNVELYFRDETLVFVFERTSHYVASVAVPGGTAVSWV